MACCNTQIEPLVHGTDTAGAVKKEHDSADAVKKEITLMLHLGIFFGLFAQICEPEIFTLQSALVNSREVV